MKKFALVSVLVLGSMSAAEAMPASVPSTGASMLPITKAEVVVRRTVVRRPPIVHRRVVRTTVVR